jgi:hypothetical protein
MQDFYRFIKLRMVARPSRCIETIAIFHRVLYKLWASREKMSNGFGPGAIGEPARAMIDFIGIELVWCA